MKLFRRSVTYTTVGVEIDQKRTTTWIALAGAVDGRVTVDLLDPFDGTEHVPTLLRLWERHPVEAIALDPNGASATLIDGLQADAAPLLLVDSRGMAVAFGRFVDWSSTGKLRHRGNRALTDAVREAAARRTVSGAQRVDRAATDPAALIAAELAVLALGDIDTAGGLGPDAVHVAHDVDPSRLPAHLQRQAEQIARGFPPPMPTMPGAPGRDPWARD